jgi:hypothetical protein
MKSIRTGMAIPEFNRETGRQRGECAQVNRHTRSRSLALSYLGTNGKRSPGATQAL